MKNIVSSKRSKKGALELEKFAKWIIAIGVLVLVVGGVVVLKDKALGAWEYAKQILRFRG